MASPATTAGRGGGGGLLSWQRLKWASFAHSTVYLVLLVAWAIPGLHGVEFVFGMAHGLGWFAMCALMLAGLKARIVNFRLATAVAVLGAVGPFIGSAEFVHQERVRARADDGDVGLH